MYITWFCTLGSALLGSKIWYFYLLVGVSSRFLPSSGLIRAIRDGGSGWM